MSSEIKIPFGYKRVPVGERAKYRDGLLLDNGKFARIQKVYGEWPVVEAHMVVIRRCVVEQPELSFEEIGDIMRQVAKATTPCLICQRPVYHYDPMICCNGADCACQGQPTNPCVCSPECSDALFNNIGRPYEERRTAARIRIFIEADTAEWPEATQ